MKNSIIVKFDVGFVSILRGSDRCEGLISVGSNTEIRCVIHLKNISTLSVRSRHTVQLS